MNRRSFLKLSSLGALTFVPATQASAMGINQAGLFRKRSWKNWVGNVEFSPESIARPKNLSELSSTITRNKSVTIQGSAHSFNNIASNDKAIIILNKLDSKIIDHGNNVFEIPGYLKLNFVNRYLHQRNVAFSSLGEIEEQTIAGLVATATHGTGMKYGTLSDSIVGMKLMLADGSILELSEKNPEDSMKLKAARVALGALGVVLSVTFKLVDMFYLEQKKFVVNKDDALNLDYIRSNDHTRLYYLPNTDKVMVKARNKIKISNVSMSEAELEDARSKDKFKDNFALDMALRLGSAMPETIITKLMNKVASDEDTSIMQGPNYLIMTKEITMKHHEMEIAVDFEDTIGAVAVVQDLIDFYKNKAKKRFFNHLPVAVRSVKGFDKAFLSPTLGRDSSYIEVLSHPSFENHEYFFRAVEKELISNFKARPHWGKSFYSDPRELYPELSDFLDIRRELDPNGKFINEYIEKNIL